MKSQNIYIRIDPNLKAAYQKVCDLQAQNPSELIRRFIQDKVKKYLVEEIQSVTLPTGKAFCDEQWVEDHKIPAGIDIEVVFHEDSISYLRSDNKWNETVEIGSDKWEDIFENYPQLLEYALGI
jgi:hypothetical protein